MKILMISCIAATLAHGGGKMPEKSGIFVDGKISVELAEAKKGGSIADPEAGSSFRMSLMTAPEDNGGGPVFSSRGGDGRQAVYITGFRRKGVSYDRPGGFVERIIVKSPEKMTLDFENGKYDGRNPDVKSVKFRKFEIKSDSVQVLIEIRTADGRTVTVAYEGAAPYDGMY